MDPCLEECINFDPNLSDCNGTMCMDPCREECINFDPNRSDCNDTMCMDPCREGCVNFDLGHPDCKNMTCTTTLIGINSTTCEINEEYQAITCGECPDTEIEIEDLTKRCRSPTP